MKNLAGTCLGWDVVFSLLLVSKCVEKNEEEAAAQYKWGHKIVLGLNTENSQKKSPKMSK